MSDLCIALQVSANNPNVGDLELDPTSSKILLTDDPSLPASRATMQDLFIRLRTFYGEWFLDPSVGLPYFRYVLVANPDIRLIESIFRRVILGTPGIASLASFSMTFDRTKRIIYPVFAGKLTTGKTFQSSDFSAFLVPV